MRVCEARPAGTREANLGLPRGARQAKGPLHQPKGKPEVGGRGQTLRLEDETSDKLMGAKAMAALAQDWRVAGSCYVPDESHRREVFNIMLSMPAGTRPEHVRDAARAFAQQTFEGHK